MGILVLADFPLRSVHPTHLNPLNYRDNGKQNGNYYIIRGNFWVI